MNKQALAFLTMFSLILMLSVYYVTLPADTTKVMSEDTSEQTVNKEETSNTSETEESKETTQKESTSSKAEVLQTSIDQKKDEEINKNSSVVSQSDSNESSKQEALNTMDTLEEQKELQGSVRSGLKEAGYDTAIEIKDSTCIVNVFEQEDSEALAKTIMAKTSQLTNQKYFIEVTFK